MNPEYGKLADAELIHPLEEEALHAVQSNPVYLWLTKEITRVKKDVADLPEAAARCFPVTPFTSPRLFRLYRTALERLGCPEEIPLFLRVGYDLTAQTVGSRSEGYLIQVNSACVEELDDGELLALLGQQLGAIRADHIRQTEMLRLLETAAQRIPMLGTMIGKQIWSGYADWLIASRYTADRAAVFAAGSFEAVESLLLRQIGVRPGTPDADAVLSQQPERYGERPGVYLIRQMQSLPVFGNVERIAELRRWVLSGEKRLQHPQVYWQARALLSPDAETPEERTVLRLHLAAYEGDPDAALQLAEMYLKGEGGLARSSSAALPLIRYASLRGNPMAMRYLISFMDREMEGQKKDPLRIAQLYRAAFSRGLRTRAGNPFPPLPVHDTAVRAGRDLLRQLYPEGREEADPVSVRNSFWIPREETVSFSEISRNADGLCFGLALADTGLYGRIGEDDLPFMLPWEEFLREPLTGREDDRGWWLFSGKTRLVRKPTDACGTASELLVRLWRLLNS